MTRASVIKQWIDLHHHADHVVQQVQAWPKELAKPIIKTINDRWVTSGQRPPYAERGLQPLRDVLAWADAIRRELESLKLEMVSGDTDLCELAERCARQCEQYPEAAEFIVRRIGLDPPDGKHVADAGKLLRMQCVRWWRRRMRAHFGQAVENAMRARGLVRKGRAAYCTDWALRRRTTQRKRTRTMLQEAIATNEEGAQFSLFELAEKSVSNPAIRRAELMTRISGFEQIATDCGHVALFGTLTAPSCYHAQIHGGGENKLYQAAGRPTVRAAQQWLCRMWAKARAKLQRLSVALYGFRIAEPHHDGTPHWHALFFVPAHQVETLRFVMRSIWLSEHGEEKGAAKHRCRFIKIDPAKGSASGYVAKYVAKNIDGFNVGPDYEAGGDASSTAHRVDAWASTHRIRQFQQIGGAPVGVWREARRVQESVFTGMEPANGKPAPSDSMVLLQAAVDFADAGDWAGFCKAAEGLEIWKEQTGECNVYAEVRQPCVIGISAGMHKVRTRVHEWRVQWRGTQQANAGRVAGFSGDSRRCEGGVVDGGENGALLYPVSHSDSASEARSLGPVSITVRSREREVATCSVVLMGHGSKSPPQPRGDGRFLYQHGDRWLIHQAVPISTAIRPPPEPPPLVSISYEGKFFCDWPRPGGKHASRERCN